MGVFADGLWSIAMMEIGFRSMRYGDINQGFLNRCGRVGLLMDGAEQMGWPSDKVLSSRFGFFSNGYGLLFSKRRDA